MKPTKEQLEFINQSKRLGSVPGLESIQALLEVLNHPEQKIPLIHVAGTNGKGSVCRYLGKVLSLSGYRTGVYTSPAVFDERERYTINEEWISEKCYWDCVEKIRQACLVLEKRGIRQPTVFEIETTLAFLYFTENGCDIGIIETGLGGRCDATNVISKPVCSVLTSIGLDHMQFLGNTHEEIALQKAGIIKTECDVVSVWQLPGVEQVLREETRRKNARIRFVRREDVCGTEEAYEYRGIHVIPGLKGAFQLPDSALAVEVLLLLGEKGYSLSREQIRSGIRQTVWPGRMEQILSEPEIWIDGAHNPAAAIQLKKTIENKFTNKRITYIMGVLADKDYRTILQETLSLAARLITVTPDNPRALSAQKLAETALEIKNIPVFPARDFDEAAREALSGNTDVILAFGSLSYLKDIRLALEKRKEEMSHV